MRAVPAHDHWIQTFSGVALDLLKPTPDMIDLVDISICLSRVVRFGGHTRDPYTVAQHSLVVSAILEAEGASALIQLQGLLHDAPEAYIGDMPTPLKNLLSEYRAVEARIWQVVATKFNLPQHLAPEVKEADHAALRAEAHVFLPGGPIGDWAGTGFYLPAPALILMLDQEIWHGGLAEMFTERVHALMAQVKATL